MPPLRDVRAEAVVGEALRWVEERVAREGEVDVVALRGGAGVYACDLIGVVDQRAWDCQCGELWEGRIA